MSLSGYSQRGYPQRIVWAGDSGAYVSDNQVRKLNIVRENSVYQLQRADSLQIALNESKVLTDIKGHRVTVLQTSLDSAGALVVRQYTQLITTHGQYVAEKKQNRLLRGVIVTVTFLLVLSVW